MNYLRTRRTFGADFPRLSRPLRVLFLITMVVVGAVPKSAWALDRDVATFSELNAALDVAQSGDRILLAPGVYQGRIFRTGLQGVSLMSQDPSQPAILDAGGNSEVMHLTSAVDVLLENLVLRNYRDNGLNIDDGGQWPAGKSSGITLRGLQVLNDTPPSGNRDAIKLSGVDNFLIDRVRVENWGDGGSAVDPVGSHHGVIQNSRFVNRGLVGGSGIRPKGGSSDIEVRGNYLELNAGRALQAGGSTGVEFFRFVPGENGYEAADIRMAGNLVVGGDSSVSWVNIDGGVVRFNLLERPTTWALRMLNENVDQPIVETQNGVFADNIVVYDDALRRISNHDGAGVLEETFHFERNRWFNASNGGPAAQADLQLPAPELDGSYGVDPQVDASAAVAFSTPWGTWAVNPHAASHQVEIASGEPLWLAVPGAGAEFSPLDDEPLQGAWSFQPWMGGVVDVAAYSQAILVTGDHVPVQTGDFDGDGDVDGDDLTDTALGFAVRFGADLEGADFLAWQRARADSSTATAAVPEVGTWTSAAAAALG
ncbi:MAG: right-handed parallel beta-helix repeat-containing protein, partial [Planctomycetales bacterium]|nr:right-handed parallel beta-helix repeat-containing protein [Planctomycetales bacterium]